MEKKKKKELEYKRRGEVSKRGRRLGSPGRMTIEETVGPIIKQRREALRLALNPINADNVIRGKAQGVTITPSKIS